MTMLPDVSRLNRRPLVWLGVFALLAAGFVLLGHSHRAPEPVYPVLVGDSPEQFFAFEPGKPLEVEFVAPADRLRGVYFRVLFRDGGHDVRLKGSNLTQNRELGESRAGFGLSADLAFQTSVAMGDRVLIEFDCRKSPARPRLDPYLKKAKTGQVPELDVTVRHQGETLQGYPQLILLYKRDWSWLRWAWLVSILGLVLVVRNPALSGAWLIWTGLCALTVGWYAWQQRYAGHIGHLDPDRYGLYGSQLAEWLRNPAARASIQDWIHGYQHAHVALVPALVALVMLSGLDQSSAYILVSAVSSFGALIVFYRLLERKLCVGREWVLLGTLSFVCHLIVVRSFGRPTTDQAGLLLVLAMLYLLVGRTQKRNRHQTLFIGLLVAPLALVRPPGLVYAAFLIAMTPMCDLIRQGKLCLADHLLTLLKVGAIPGLAVLGLYLGFDWFHNFELALEKRLRFLDQWAFYWFRIMMVVAVQGFFIGWFLLRWRRDWRPIAVLGSWLILHTLLLVVSQAPFLTRLMTPVIPSIVALAVMGLDRLKGWTAWPGYALLFIHVAVNLLLVHWVIDLPHIPKYPLDHWFYG